MVAHRNRSSAHGLGRCERTAAATVYPTELAKLRRGCTPHVDCAHRRDLPPAAVIAFEAWILLSLLSDCAVSLNTVAAHGEDQQVRTYY